MPNFATMPVTDLQALVVDKHPRAGAGFGARGERSNRDIKQCTEGEMGKINEDLTGHLSMTSNEKNKDFNIKCLWGILCFWVNCKNWHPVSVHNSRLFWKH